MSGIGGLATADVARVPPPDPLRRLAEALRHRGLDGQGLHVAPGIGLAASRWGTGLGGASPQPLVSADGAIALVVDGTFHGARRVRRDLEARGHRFVTEATIEVAIPLYLERGLDFLHALRGAFALALWDSRERRLILARDRMGIRSLAYAETPEGLAFASEAKGLLAAGWVEASLDAGAADALFRFGAVHAPRTAFEGIRALLPGERLEYRAGTSRMERWWDLGRDSGFDPPRSAEGWAEGLRDRLTEAVRIQAEDARPAGVWLSGGVDSSAVAALAVRSFPDPIDAVTLAFEDPAYDEASGGTLAEFADLPLRPRQALLRDADFAELPDAIWHTETPTTYAIEVPRLALARASAAAGHRVALSGEGADAILGGGWWVPLDLWFRPLAALPRWVRAAPLVGPLSPERHPWGAGAWLAPAEPPLSRYEAMNGLRYRSERRAFYTPALRERVDVALARGPAIEDALPPRPPGIAFSAVEYVHVKLHLPDFTTLKVDRTAMAFGIDVRLPFLDHEVVEYAARIPARLKLRVWSRKNVLRRAMRGLLPDQVRLRAKRGLAAPFARWMREPLPEAAEALLSPESLRAKGYFDPLRVRDRLVGHRGGTVDAGAELVGVLTVQMWDEIFVARRRPWEGFA